MWVTEEVKNRKVDKRCVFLLRGHDTTKDEIKLEKVQGNEITCVSIYKKNIR